MGEGEVEKKRGKQKETITLENIKYNGRKKLKP